MHKNVSQILAIIDSSSREIAGKKRILLKKRRILLLGNINLGKIRTLLKKRRILLLGNIDLGQTSRLNLDKFGIGNDIHDCRSAPIV